MWWAASVPPFPFGDDAPRECVWQPSRGSTAIEVPVLRPLSEFKLVKVRGALLFGTLDAPDLVRCHAHLAGFACRITVEVAGFLPICQLDFVEAIDWQMLLAYHARDELLAGAPTGPFL